MNIELKAALQPVSVFLDDGFRVGKNEYSYSDVSCVNLFAHASALTNGVIQVTVDGKLINVAFDKKHSQEGDQVYFFLQQVVKKNQDHAAATEYYDFSTAEGLYQYCIDNSFGRGLTDNWALKHFRIIAESLLPGEEVKFSFIGLHNYVSMTKHDNNYAYVVTDRRILIAQKKVIGQEFQTIDWKNINDITLSTGAVIGTVCIDTFKETFNVGVDKFCAQAINTKFHQVLDEFRRLGTPAVQTAPISDPYEELKKLKDLLDLGIVSEEEFNAKKRELLGL